MLVLLGILVLGAIFRLSAPDLGWFIMDGVRDAVEAIAITEGRTFPLVGPVAAGVPALGPLYYYLLAIPFAFSKDPMVGVFFLNLLNLAAVYLTYRLGKTFFDTTVGLAAAAFYAIYPMAVIDSKVLWNPGFIPFFTSIFFYSLYQFLVDERPGGLVGALGSLACCLQVHLSSAVLVLLLLIVLILFRPRCPWPHLTVGLALVLVLYAPYLVFQLQQGFAGVKGVVALVGAEQSIPPDVSAFTIAWQVLTSPYMLPVKLAEATAPGALPAWIIVLQRVECVLFLGGFIYLLGVLIKRWKWEGQVQPAYAILVLWILLPAIVLAQRKVGVPWYYAGLLYPARPLVLGVLVSACLAYVRRIEAKSWALSQAARGGGGVLLGAILASQAFLLLWLGHAIITSGAIRLTPDFLFLRIRDATQVPDLARFPLAQFVVETMPVRYRKELAGRLSAGFQADPVAFERQIHGSSYQDLREDKGYSLTYLSRAATSPGLVSQHWHYLLLRDDRHTGAISQERTVRLGPFRIVAYQPLIDYTRWNYQPLPMSRDGWQQRAFDDSTWSPIQLPARGRYDLFNYSQTLMHSWPASSLAFRGWVDPPPLGTRLRIVVGLRDDIRGPPLVTNFHVNDKKIDACRSVVYYSIVARNHEIVFDVTATLTQESNLIAFQISSSTPDFDIDVYELLADEVCGG